jgi:hypothetical protein
MTSAHQAPAARGSRGGVVEMDVGRRLSNLLGLGRRGAERRWSYVGAGLVGIVAGLVATVWPTGPDVGRPADEHTR